MAVEAPMSCPSGLTCGSIVNQLKNKTGCADPAEKPLDDLTGRDFDQTLRLITQK